MMLPAIKVSFVFGNCLINTNADNGRQLLFNKIVLNTGGYFVKHYPL